MRRIPWVLVGVAALVTVAAFAGGLWWRLDLLAHFRAHYAVGALVLAGAIAAFRRWRPAVAAAVVAAVNLVLVVPVYCGRDRDPGTPRLRVLVANVHTANTNHDPLLRLVDETDPDVIALVEVDHRWIQALAPLAPRYPHREAEPRDDNFGVMLLSRRPFTATVAEAETPFIRADVAGVDLFVIHPIPPVSAAASASRDRTLAAIARLAGPSSLVCGDFNATPWSHAFRRFVDASGLRDSRRGFGHHATWPSWLGAAGIPIDHCLVGERLAVTGRRVLGDIGSDHLPIVIDVKARR